MVSLYNIVIPMLQYYPDRPSGSTRLAFDEACYLAQQGHEVWVIAPGLSGEKPEYAYQDGLHVLRYQAPDVGLFTPRRITVHQKLTAAIARKYIKQSVDLVHGHSLLQYAGMLRAYPTGTRVGYTVHSPVKLETQATARNEPVQTRSLFMLKGFMLHCIERRCLQRSDYITTDSHYTKAQLEHLHGKRIQHKAKVIPGWVDTNRFQVVTDRHAAKTQLGWSTDVPVLFTLRRLVPRMGLDRLLYALHEISSIPFHMIIGGQGPLRTSLESLAADLGLERHVHFAGFIPDDMLPLMYGAADAFVLPTTELECFGIIVLESLACGRPVLATPVGAIPEILQQVEPGWLSADASVASMARLLLDFLHNRLSDHSPQYLREFVVNHYSAELILKQLTFVALGFQAINQGNE